MRSLLRPTLLVASVLVSCWGIPGCSSEPEAEKGKMSGPMDKMDTGKMDKMDTGKMDAGKMDKMDTGKMSGPMDKMDTGKMSGPMDKMDTGMIRAGWNNFRAMIIGVEVVGDREATHGTARGREREAVARG